MRTYTEIQNDRIATLVENLRYHGPGTVSAVRNRLWRSSKERVLKEDFAEAHRRGLVTFEESRMVYVVA